MQETSVRVFTVEGEGGLAVGTRLDQAVAVSAREQPAKAVGGDSPAAVLGRMRRHAEPHVVVWQGEEPVEVGGSVGAGEQSPTLRRTAAEFLSVAHCARTLNRLDDVNVQ